MWRIVILSQPPKQCTIVQLIQAMHGLYSEDSSIEWNPKSRNTLETQNADHEVNQEITTQTNLSESTQEVAQREIGTTLRITPQTSEDTLRMVTQTWTNERPKHTGIERA